MIPYFIELEEYSEKEILKHFDGDLKKILLEKGLLKAKNSFYRFKYVGLFTYKKQFFFVFPKYFTQFFLENLSKKELLTYIQILIRVIVKNIKNYKIQRFEAEPEDFEVISDILTSTEFLLNDYLEYGYYIKEYVDVSEGTDGIIDWESTINENDSIFTQQSVIYYPFQIQRDEIDQSFIITLIHKMIVSDLHIRYGEILGYNDIEIECLNQDLNINNEFLIYSLEKELTSVFQQRNIRLLSALKKLILEEYSGENNFNLIGTFNFEQIWENSIRNIFGDYLEEFKKDLEKNQKDNRKYLANWKHTDLFEKEPTLSSPFKLDALTKFNEKYIIIDAKYYNIDWNKQGNFEFIPGINDIAKQHIYAMIIKDFYKIEPINAFIFPKIDILKDKVYVGTVNLPIIDNNNKIHLFCFNPAFVYDYFLKDIKLTGEDLYKLIK